MPTISTISHFYKLLLLKNKPQDLPYSIPTWVMLFVVANGLFFYINRHVPIVHNLLLIYWVQNVVFLLTVYYFLKRFNLASRFIQTTANFLGISIINTVMLRAIFNITHNSVVICLFFGWVIMLKIHIIQHSFGVSRGRAFLFLIIFLLIPTLAVMSIMQIFPAAIPPEIIQKG